MSSSSAQYIYTMHKVSRFHPPDKEVLKDITLSFYPGAKIGVIGSNGAGKSSLLRIMAGLDDGYTGEARLSPGFTVRSEEHTSELQSLMRISYAVFCLKKKKEKNLRKYLDVRTIQKDKLIIPKK